MRVLSVRVCLEYTSAMDMPVLSVHMAWIFVFLGCAYTLELGGRVSSEFSVPLDWRLPWAYSWLSVHVIYSSISFMQGLTVVSYTLPERTWALV